jgi:hypothetical protein
MPASIVVLNQIARVMLIVRLLAVVKDLECSLLPEVDGDGVVGVRRWLVE